MEVIINTKISPTEIEDQLRAEGYKLHHTSRALGYIPSGKPSLLVYKGRFGEGWVLHYPSNLSNRFSTNYHDIAYYIK